MGLGAPTAVGRYFRVSLSAHPHRPQAPEGRTLAALNPLALLYCVDPESVLKASVLISTELTVLE